MKLWHSFRKEVKLASQSWYFYVELVMAVIFLLILLFVIPEKFQDINEEYVFLDLPAAYVKSYHELSLAEDLDGSAEQLTVKIGDVDYPATHYLTDEKHVYYMESEQAVQAAADQLQKFAATVNLGADGKQDYTYYLQGYESERFVNLISILHNDKVTYQEMEPAFKTKKVNVLRPNQVLLSDRQNTLPIFLTLNGSFMGMFIIAAYIFLDKAEGLIKAYAVTASHVWEYLLSKVGVVVLTCIISSLITTIPVMGLQPNYLLLLVFLTCSGFFAMTIGLVISTYYSDMMQAMSVLFMIIIAMMIPNIAYMIPSWQPAWLQLLPTHYMLQSFKEILLPDTDVGYVLLSSLAFLTLGAVLFAFANDRFKRTLSV